MRRLGRSGLSAAQKKNLWRRWKSGQSLSDIGRALGKHVGSIHGVVAASGGIAPRSRTRSHRSLQMTEREEISRGLSKGSSIRMIAKRLCRSPSTISREVRKNGGIANYRALRADQRAWQKALRPKLCLLARHQCLRDTVAQKLASQWSPSQISGWLMVEYSDDKSMPVSHETIYKSLFIQARGVLKKELMGHLRSRRKMRRSKKSSTQGQPRGQIVDAVSISERPAEIEDRAVPGHWEGDLISGSKTAICNAR